MFEIDQVRHFTYCHVYTYQRSHNALVVWRHHANAVELSLCQVYG